MPELTPELELMLELLRGWGYHVYPTAVCNRSQKSEYPAVQIQLEPEGLHFKIWATKRSHLHLQLLLWGDDQLLEGDKGFDEAFDKLTIGALKAAVKAAPDIFKAWLLILKVVRPERELHFGTLLFSDDARGRGTANVSELLREYLSRMLAGVVG